MKPNKIHIFFSMLVLSLAVFSAGCSAFIAPTPTSTPDPFVPFQSPDGLFSLSVPIGWTPSSSRTSDGTLNLYKFIAPDQHGFVQVVVAIRDQPVPAEIANAFTLRVLQGYAVETDTIKILTDQTAADGRRTLTWHAKQGLIGGTTIVERPGTKLIVVTASNLDAANTDYQPLFDHVLSTYKTK